jgi:hypothetical protein
MWVLALPLSLPSHLPLKLAPHTGTTQRSFLFLIRTYVINFVARPVRQRETEKLAARPHPHRQRPWMERRPCHRLRGIYKGAPSPSSVPQLPHAYQADRETTTFDEMQQKTVDYVQSHHHDLDVEQTHATYARDEVGGPLGNAGVGEFEGVVGKDDLGPDDAQVESDGRVVTRRVIHEKTTVRKGGSGPGKTNVSRDRARRHSSAG